jgi:hypothetical protein
VEVTIEQFQFGNYSLGIQRRTSGTLDDFNFLAKAFVMAASNFRLRTNPARILL